MLQDVAIGRSAVAFDPDTTLCVVVEMSLSSWLVAGLLPGVERRPLKKMGPDEAGLFALVERWRAGAANRPLRSRDERSRLLAATVPPKHDVV